jgi:hypothetical protein
MQKRLRRSRIKLLTAPERSMNVKRSWKKSSQCMHVRILATIPVHISGSTLAPVKYHLTPIDITYH